MGTYLQWLIQFFVRGQVVSSSGVTRPVVNGFVYSSLAIAPLAADKLLMWNAFHAACWSLMAVPLNVAYTGVHGDVLLPNTPGDTQLSVGVPASGGRGGGRMQLNVCAYMNVMTGLRGRQFTGSKRMGPICVSDVVGEELFVPGDIQWISATSAPQQNFTYVSPVSGPVTCFPVVWSRTLSALDTMVPPARGGFITGVHLNRTLGQWKHRRERVVR